MCTSLLSRTCHEIDNFPPGVKIDSMFEHSGRGAYRANCFQMRHLLPLSLSQSPDSVWTIRESHLVHHEHLSVSVPISLIMKCEILTRT